MKKTLVNHGGTIQYKILIKTQEQLMEYAELNSNIMANEFCALLQNKPDELTHHQKMIKSMAQNSGESIIVTCDRLPYKKIMNMLKAIVAGHIVVVNNSNGYCYWSDKEMSLVEETEENIKLANQIDGPKYEIEYDIFHGVVLILENQSKIPDSVIEYVTGVLGQKEYAYVKNISLDSDHKLAGIIQSAIKMGIHTIVAETTLTNENQVYNLIHLLSKCPKMHICLKVYLGTEKLEEKLKKIVHDDELVEKVLSTHQITLF